jgi:hypothetical protein
MRFPRSRVGMVFASLYLLAFIFEYFDYLANKGTWFADMGLDILALPYIFVGRGLTLDPTFELHGAEVLGLIPGGAFCTVLAYFVGYGLERLARRIYRMVFKPVRKY